MNLCEASKLLNETNHIHHPSWPKTLWVKEGSVLDGFNLIMHYPGGGQSSFTVTRKSLSDDRFVVIPDNP